MTGHDARPVPAITRRRLLRGGATAAAVGLAGCLSSDGESAPDDPSNVSVASLRINGTDLSGDPRTHKRNTTQATIQKGEDVDFRFYGGNNATYDIETTFRITIGPETQTRTVTLPGDPKDPEFGSQIEVFYTMSDITDNLPPGTYDVELTADGQNHTLEHTVIYRDALRVTP